MIKLFPFEPEAYSTFAQFQSGKVAYWKIHSKLHNRTFGKFKSFKLARRESALLNREINKLIVNLNRFRG